MRDVEQRFAKDGLCMARPKVLLVLLLAAIACLAVMFYVPRQSGGTASRPPEVGEVAIETNAAPKDVPAANGTVVRNARKNRSARDLAGNTPQPSSTFEISDRGTTAEEEKVDSIVKAKFEQLQDLATKSDPASMEAILAEMKSPYPEVRGDALEAIIQFRSRDAIPALKELAAQTEYPKEKVAILEAVEFLQLPTLDEFLADLEKDKTQNPQDGK